MKKVTIHLKNQDVDELEVLLFSEYDACTVSDRGEITLYSRKACDIKNRSLSNLMNTTNRLVDSSFSTRSIKSLDHRNHEYRYFKGQIVWAKSSRICPYWPSYVLDVEESCVHLYYISRSKFSNGAGAVVVEMSKVIPYSLDTTTSVMSNGLEYYKRLQLWNYMSDFFNAVLLAKTFISFQKRNFFKSQSEIHRFFNSDLPLTQPKDSHTPPGSIKCIASKKRSFSVGLQKKNVLKQPKRLKTVQPKNNCDNSAFQQRVYHHIMNGKCSKHLSRILLGTVPCERWKTVHRCNMSTSQLKSWRKIYINPYFHTDSNCDNVLAVLRDLITGSKVPLPKFFHLLYDVLYPEAIIEAIRSLGRLEYHEADMMYRNTLMSVDENDKAFHKVLTHRERELIQSRICQL